MMSLRTPFLPLIIITYLSIVFFFPHRNLLTAFHVHWHMNIRHTELKSRCDLSANKYITAGMKLIVSVI